MRFLVVPADMPTAFMELHGSGRRRVIARTRAELEKRIEELAPRYVDVTIARFERATKADAVHSESGKTYAEVAQERVSHRCAQGRSQAVHIQSLHEPLFRELRSCERQAQAPRKPRRLFPTACSIVRGQRWKYPAQLFPSLPLPPTVLRTTRLESRAQCFVTIPCKRLITALRMAWLSMC